MLRWQTSSYSEDPGANALDFGVLYNFRFDAPLAPVAATASLSLFRPGPGSDDVAFPTRAPAAMTSVPGATGAPAGEPRQPAALVLRQNEPNPVRGETSLNFTLARAGAVRFEIIDATGRVVRSLTTSPFGPGDHAVTWDGKDAGGRPVRAGVYYYRAISGGAVAVRTLVVAR